LAATMQSGDKVNSDPILRHSIVSNAIPIAVRMIQTSGACCLCASFLAGGCQSITGSISAQGPFQDLDCNSDNLNEALKRASNVAPSIILGMRTLTVALLFIMTIVTVRYAAFSWTGKWNHGESVHDRNWETALVPSHTIFVALPVLIGIVWIGIAYDPGPPWLDAFALSLAWTGCALGFILVVVRAPFQVLGLAKRSSLWTMTAAFLIVGTLISNRSLLLA
jgi:hypothetical protein